MSIANHLAFPSVPDAVDADAVARLPRALAFRFDAVPLQLDAGVLTVGVHDPADLTLVDTLRSVTRLRITAVRMTRETIRARLAIAYPPDPAAGSGGPAASADVPAVRRVDALFERAIAAHASDVHIEPDVSGGTVRFRVDGVLTPRAPIDTALFAAVVSRIKLRAGMDIADRRQPQDGRFTLTIDGRDIDARVSSMPTIAGEKLVIRLLDLHAQTCALDALGLPPTLAASFRDLVRLPWGFVVVTGPTGSGKTTTLYAALAEIDAATNNVCSVEDPVERRLRGVTQVGVNPRAGLTFASALRSFMRQDPNVIMVGEMRDAETAGVAISASLAGQLVLTTLHSNDAPRTVERLVELGVARQSLAAGLTGVLAQRLVRRLCDACRRETAIPADARAHWEIAQPTWYVPTGCRACDGTGYSGRIGVFELVAVDDTLRDAIGAGASSVALAQLAARDAYRPMFFDGLAKACAGVTSFAEVRRVVGGPAR